MSTRRGPWRWARGRAVLLAAAALGVEILLRTTALGAPVWEARGRARLARGEMDQAVEALERAVDRGARGEARLALVRAHAGQGRLPQALAHAESLAATSQGALRHRAWHALSALHLEAAPAGAGPGGLQDAGAAADAAREALRLDPGNPGARWNLYLARGEDDEPGDGPDETGSGSRLSPATARRVRAALAQVEARNLRESLAAILGELERTGPPSPDDDPRTEGPPW